MSAIEHRFGPYGGQYVPETLMPALAELEAAWVRGPRRPGVPAELAALLRDYVGRPSPLYLAARLSEAAGHPVYLKREDLNHTGAHKINNALGQALLAQRMGKRRIIAETGAGQHGVATATACALLDLECIVYMGTEDMRRQKPNVERMGLLGRPWSSPSRPAPGRSRRRSRRRSATGSPTSRPPTTSSARASGPAPYPALVRDLQRVIGDEARAQVLGAGGPAARAGDRVRRRRLERDRDVRPVRRRRRGRAGRRRGGGRGDRDRAPRRAADGRRHCPGCCTAPTRRSCRTRTARSSRPTRSPPASTIRAAAPSTPGCATRAAPATSAITDAQALDAFARISRLEGIIPALESAHALAWALANPDSELDLVCLSGRGDKDLAEALAQLRDRVVMRGQPGQRADRRGVRVGARRRAPRGADAVPDGRLSRPRDARARSALAYVEAGADLIELGVPFSDPLADGPVIHAAGTAALRAGATLPAVLDGGRARSPPRCRWWSCVTRT